MFSLRQKFPDVVAYLKGKANVKLLFMLNSYQGSRLVVLKRPDGMYYVQDVLARDVSANTYALFVVSGKLLHAYLTTRKSFRNLLTAMPSECSCLPYIIQSNPDTGDIRNICEVTMTEFLHEEEFCGEQTFVATDCHAFDLEAVKLWVREYDKDQKGLVK